jgi:hypothetical protein
MAPDRGLTGPERYAESRVEQILDDHEAWPANVLKLECEGVGIYQNITGRVISHLEDQGEISKSTVSLRGYHVPFIGRPGDSIEPSEEIRDATVRLYEFLEESGHFGDLTAYVALCKVHSEIGNNITSMDVLPEGSRADVLAAPNTSPDGLVILPDEYVPIEVYNGQNYLGTGHKKHNQLRNASRSGEIESNPFLINRRCDEELKKEVRRMNGMVVDTDCILACKADYPDFDETLSLFNLSDIVHLLPKLENADGYQLGTEEFEAAAGSDSQADRLRPPSQMAGAAEELPDQYMKRIRGGLQLQYVNSFYRRAGGSIEKDACFVLQTIYNQLLREGGKTRNDALEEGWSGAAEKYRRLNKADSTRSSILDQTGEFLSELRQQGVVVERSGKLHARASEHPQQAISFGG